MNIYFMTLIWLGILAANALCLVLIIMNDAHTAAIIFVMLVCAVSSWRVQHWVRQGVEDFNDENS